MTNAELESMLDTSDTWIRERTGIRQRHIAGEKETTCDLAEAAAREALAAAGVKAQEIDLVLIATATSERAFPSTACLLQDRLGIRGAPAFDLQAVCSGFVYALTVADKFIRAGDCRTALVAGAEIFSRLVDWSDRSTCPLFGDGAGAVVLRADTQAGIFYSRLYADGSYHRLLYASGNGCSNGNEKRHIRMQGSEVFKLAVKTMSQSLLEALREGGLDKGELDWLVPHQANRRILQAVAQRIGLADERVISTIERHGNTSAASVPLALDNAVREGRIRVGDRVALNAFGSGFTWGSVLLRY